MNGKPVTVETDPEMMVLDVIRELLNLTGTKHGCDNSTCGTCTIVVNGKAVKSCNLPLKKIAGAEVLTIEGLAKGTQLHPVQKAISESGAIQCGFAPRDCDGALRLLEEKLMPHRQNWKMP